MDNRCLVILNTEVRFVMKGKDEIWMDTGEGKKKGFAENLSSF